MPTTADHHVHFTVPGSHIQFKPLLLSGLIAGLVFLVLEVLMLYLIMGVNLGVMPRMIAAITMGRGALPPPDTLDLTFLVPALIIHFGLSLIYALVFAFFAKGRTLLQATGLGAVFGLLIYGINFYGFTELFPWFIGARSWISVSAHLVYGALLGGIYAYFAKPEEHHFVSHDEHHPV